jgi:uncharacterized surface protein with fasciclin (FAS1) repeats
MRGKTSLLAACVAALILAGCGTGAPVATQAPIVEAPTTGAEVATVEPTAVAAPAEPTVEATVEATTEATAEPTAEMTATDAMTSTEAMTSTDSMTATGTTTATGDMTGGTVMTGTDIVATALSAGNFKTLASALTAADLVDTLKGAGPFTVFAPTDEAFAKLDAATLADLLKPENKDELVRVLTYHVVPGRVLAEDVSAMTSATTVEGGNLTIATSGSDVTINGATVVTPDIETSNGVIHAIDTVLLPPN